MHKQHRTMLEWAIKRADIITVTYWPSLREVSINAETEEGYDAAIEKLRKVIGDDPAIVFDVSFPHGQAHHSAGAVTGAGSFRLAHIKDITDDEEVAS